MSTDKPSSSKVSLSAAATEVEAMDESNTSNISSTSNGVIIEQVNHQQHVLQSLESLLVKEDSTDVTLKVGNSVYKAHRLVLAARSDVFHIMLLSNHWQESDQPEIPLEETHECQLVFSEFLHYIYTGNLQLTLEHAPAFFVLANKYNIRELYMDVQKYILNHLECGMEVSVVLSWWQLAQLHDNVDIQSKCEEIIFSNFQHVAESKSWLDLKEPNIEKILSSSLLVVQDEYTVYEAAVTWLNEKHALLVALGNQSGCDDAANGNGIPNDVQDEWLSCLHKVLGHIRFHLIRPSNLGQIESSDLYRQYTAMLETRVLYAYRFQCFPRNERRQDFLNAYPDTGLRIYTNKEYSHDITNMSHHQPASFRTTSTGSLADNAASASSLHWALRTPACSIQHHLAAPLRPDGPIFVNGQPYYLNREGAGGRPIYVPAGGFNNTVQGYLPEKLNLTQTNTEKMDCLPNVNVMLLMTNTNGNVTFQRLFCLATISLSNVANESTELQMPPAVVQQKKEKSASSSGSSKNNNNNMHCRLLILPDSV